MLIRQRVDTQPHGHQLVIHVPCTEVSVASFSVLLFAREGETFTIAIGALYVVSYHHQVNNEDVCFLLPSMPYHSSTLLLRIANPAQRERQSDNEHLPLLSCKSL